MLRVARLHVCNCLQRTIRSWLATCCHKTNKFGFYFTVSQVFVPGKWSNGQTQWHRMDKSGKRFLFCQLSICNVLIFLCQSSQGTWSIKPCWHFKLRVFASKAQGCDWSLVCNCQPLPTVSVNRQLSQCHNCTRKYLAKEPMVWWQEHLFFQKPWCKQGNHCRSMPSSWTLLTIAEWTVLNLTVNSLCNQFAQCETRTGGKLKKNTFPAKVASQEENSPRHLELELQKLRTLNHVACAVHNLRLLKEDVLNLQSSEWILNNYCKCFSTFRASCSKITPPFRTDFAGLRAAKPRTLWNSADKFVRFNSMQLKLKLDQSNSSQFSSAEKNENWWTGKSHPNTDERSPGICCWGHPPWCLVPSLKEFGKTSPPQDWTNQFEKSRKICLKKSVKSVNGK